MYVPNICVIYQYWSFFGKDRKWKFINKFMVVNILSLISLSQISNAGARGSGDQEIRRSGGQGIESSHLYNHPGPNYLNSIKSMNMHQSQTISMDGNLTDNLSCQLRWPVEHCSSCHLSTPPSPPVIKAPMFTPIMPGHYYTHRFFHQVLSIQGILACPPLAASCQWWPPPGLYTSSHRSA